MELLVNGASLGKKKQGEAPGVEAMPCTFLFDAVYEPGEVTAVSYTDGKEISRDTVCTAGKACALRIAADKQETRADGHGVIYVSVEVVDAEGRLVPDAEVVLQANAEGALTLAGFGSGNPITAENYTGNTFTTYRGRACAVLRSGYEAGEAKLTVDGGKLGACSAALTVKSL